MRLPAAFANSSRNPDEAERFTAGGRNLFEIRSREAGDSVLVKTERERDDLTFQPFSDSRRRNPNVKLPARERFRSLDVTRFCCLTS